MEWKSVEANQPRRLTRQQSQAQREHEIITPTKGQSELSCEAGQYMPNQIFQSEVKKTRGITQGLGTQNLINSCNQRIPIRTNGEQKLPQTVQANVKFKTEIGIQTRQHAPLLVRRWRDVSAVDKAKITKELAIKFDFDNTDPGVRKFIEGHMAKSYRRWRSRMHLHYKQHAHDTEYARAHPPEKLFHKRQMSEWEWMCDNLYTDEAYVKRCKIASANRNKLDIDQIESSPQEMPKESSMKHSDYGDDDDENDDVDNDNGKDEDDVDYNIDDDYVEYNEDVNANDEDDAERNQEVDTDIVEMHGNQVLSTYIDKSSGKRKPSCFTNVGRESSKKRNETPDHRFTDSAPVRGSVEVQSAAKEVSDEEYLMQCFGILNKMEEIDDDSYSKALKLFRGDATWTKLFVGMPDKRRKNFILNLFCT